MTVNQFIPPILSVAFQKARATMRRTYRIGTYVLNVPPGYALPQYQQTEKLFDRFLPVLARHLTSDGSLIDVGANIGDTAIALVQHCRNPILCVEASNRFFPYLETNLSRLSSADSSRVKAIKRLVGTGRFSGVLHHLDRGTASIRLVDSAGEGSQAALDELVDDPAKISLLKVDTDGFDFDVITSARSILTHSKPLLFWENQIAHEFQRRGFDELYALLEDEGYSHLCIFDNFGNLITSQATFATLRDINAYTCSMDWYGCTRTIYYTDVLAATERDRCLVEEAIAEYRTKWINRCSAA